MSPHCVRLREAKTCRNYSNTACNHRSMSMLALSLLCSIGLMLLPMVNSQPSPTPEFQNSADGDLLIGRGQSLHASSTCGLMRPENYCSLNVEGQKCDVCDSRLEWDGAVNTESHRIQNVVGKIRRPSEMYASWWMSEPGHENVSIRLDLEANFHFTHLIMIFKSSRPKAFYIERSTDFGTTWQPYRYFAENCRETFPDITFASSIRRITLGEIVCVRGYTSMSPLTKGQVAFQVLNEYQTINKTYAELSPYLSITNLRIVFVKYHTFSDDIQKQDSSVNSKYYYAIYEINVHGTCICNNHAKNCGPSQPDMLALSEPDMVHGKCMCVHNTDGLNCERCKALYNEVPWQEGPGQCKACECNMHAFSCRFDEGLYRSSNFTAGGVCVDCQHNTDGRQCERCLAGFFRNYNVDPWSPDICRPCLCDASGTLGNDENNCAVITDKPLGQISGQCRCKANVAGRQCNLCKDGFWDMNENNDEGCRPCGCMQAGTKENRGCHQVTGRCDCKANVLEPRCEECQNGFYNLTSDNPQGCSPCNCVIAASISEVCHKQTGACTCNTGMTGKRCHEVKPGYFLPDVTIDVNVFNPENQRNTTDVDDENTIVVYTTPERPEDKFWSGTGGVRIANYGQLVVNTQPNKLPPGDYVVSIKYRTENMTLQSGLKWPILVNLERSQPKPGSRCDGRQLSNSFTIEAENTKKGEMNVLQIADKICIDEEGLLSVTIRPEDKPSPNAVIEIDAIVISVNITEIVPKIISPKPFTVKTLDERQLTICLDHFNTIVQGQTAPDFCKDLKLAVALTASPKVRINKCECNMTGSVTSNCSSVGGQCNCRSNVTGRQCDNCFPFHYGFGRPEGCSPCNCHKDGSESAECNSTTGQCVCKPNGFGRTCGECKRGFYKFPLCIPCECNGFADSCQSEDGVCQNCTDNTAGRHCELCKSGYFGDPLNGVPCRPCRCPGGLGSSFQHAKTCRLIEGSKNELCDCENGYEGNQCESCQLNWYGRPSTPGGVCMRCGCNNNIDRMVNNSCDAVTGQCIKCLYNTEGYNCENCAEGYTGDAARPGGCRMCLCNSLGTQASSKIKLKSTDEELWNCDLKNGQCRCLPRVEGLQCERCAADSWDHGNSGGCQACQCDPLGSEESQCDLFTGLCRCKPGRGGRQCNQCSDLHYGDPTRLNGCKPCACDAQGSASLQCDRHSGRCFCLSGVDGEKCDRCARGTRGQFPNCESCGECWINWDKVLQELTNSTAALRERATHLAARGGLTGTFGDELGNITVKLQNIEQVLRESNVSSSDVDDVRLVLNKVNETFERENLEPNGLRRLQFQNLTDTVQNELDDVQRQADALKRKLEALSDKINRLEADQRLIKSTSPEGNYQAIMRNQQRARSAYESVMRATDSIQSSNATLDTISASVDLKQENITALQSNLNRTLVESSLNLTQLSNRVPQINEKVCGGSAKEMIAGNQFCHASCGGAGCSECGARTACKNSLVRNVVEAEKRLEDARNKSAHVEMFLEKLREQVINASNEADNVRTQTQALYRDAVDLLNRAQEENQIGQSLLTNITNFLSNPMRVTSEKLSNELQREPEKLSVQEDEMRQIAEQIQQLSQLHSNNINDILNQTLTSRTKAEELMLRARDVMNQAIELSQQAGNISNARVTTERAQNETRQVLDSLEERFLAIEQINNETAKSWESTKLVYAEIQQKLNDLKKNIKSLKTREATRASDLKNLNSEVSQTRDKVSEIERVMENTRKQIVQLNDTYIQQSNISSSRQQRVMRLQDRLAAFEKNIGDGSYDSEEIESIARASSTSLSEIQRELDEFLRLLEDSVTKKGSLLWLTNRINSGD